MNQLALLKSGLHLEPSVPAGKLIPLFQRLWPQIQDRPLVRIGAAHDGGYICPEDFVGVKACFSLGVGNTSSFESDLYQRYRLISHLADASANLNSASEFPGTFVKKYIGPQSVDETITFAEWISLVEPEFSEHEYIAQIDIEGNEYLTLLALEGSIVQHFRIIVIEFHQIYNWANPIFFPFIDLLWAKLLSNYTVVHLHPNNNDGEVELFFGRCPRTIEVTLYRNDRIVAPIRSANLPNILDSTNNPTLPEVYIPDYWRS